MPDLLTPNKGFTEPTVGSDNNTWGGLLNTDLSLIDSALGGTLSLSISGNTNLTSTQVENTGYEFTGTLSATATIMWPAFSGMAAIQNATAGGHSISCGISGGAFVSIPNGSTYAIWSDGANFVQLTGVGATTGSGPVVLENSPTIGSPTFTGTVSGAGTIPNSVLVDDSITLAGHTVALGGSQNLAASDLTNGVTGSGNIVLQTSPTIASPTFTGTVAGAGTVPNSVLQDSAITIAGHTVALGGSQNLAASDLTNGTTGSGDVVLATSPTIASPTFTGTVSGLSAGEISGLAAVATSGSASDLTTGTLPNGRLSAVPNSALANSSITIAGHTVSLGGTQALAASDLTNGVTGSGDIVLQVSPTVDQSLLVQGGSNNSGNTLTINNRTRVDSQLAVNVEAGVSSGDFVIMTNGNVGIGTSTPATPLEVHGTANFTGTFEINGTAETFPASGLLVGTTDTQSLSNKTLASPTFTGTVTGAGTVPNAVLANSSVTISSHALALGGSLNLAAGDISGLAASATTDTTNASNITSGTLPNARLVAVPNSALANSSITVAGHSVALGGSQNLAASDLTNGTFGSGAVVLRTGLPYVDVKANGAAGNGSTDDASVINACITAITSTGGVVFFPPGVYIVGSSITVPSNITLLGSGRGATILRAKPSTSVDVVLTTNFFSLVGTNSTAGSYKFGLRSLSIDGNKANSATGNGLTIYGYDFNLDDLEIYNCSGVCLYSEWGTSGTVPTSDGDSMEAHIHGLKTYGAGVDGIQWFGPHDSTMDDVQTFINGRYGLYVENTPNYFGGGTMFSNFHSYGNANHGVLCNANIYCNGFESESNTGGDGIHIIDTDFGFFDARGVSVYNNSGDGFNITAGFATIAGIQAFNNTGNGVVVGAASTMSDVVAYSNGGMGVHVTADSWVFSAVRVFSNTGNGMQIDAPSTTNGVYTYNNGGDGLVINASDATADGINAQNNTGTGIKINGTFQSLVVSGKASGNATQLDLGTVAAPSIVDVVTFNTVTPAGQTSYTGTPGDVFLRIGTAGTGALSSLNQVQT